MVTWQVKIDVILLFTCSIVIEHKFGLNLIPYRTKNTGIYIYRPTLPLLLTIKDYRDSINYRDIFRAAIVIVNFLLSSSTNPDTTETWPGWSNR